MRKAASFAIPMTIMTLYYAFWFGLMLFLLANFPGLKAAFPVGGVGEMALDGSGDFEPIYTAAKENVLSQHGGLRLLLASIGAAILIVPVSWVYIITSRTKEVDQSLVQSIIILPIVVTGISMIVMNSLALAFSLAGIVAAVRFRITLARPAHAMYIFVAISIGLGAGIGALGVALVISMAFVFVTMTIWKLEYGRDLHTPFLSMLTRRSRGEDDYP